MAIAELPQTTVRVLRSTQSLVGPVAVVKELIDNALDAGATSISIELSSNLLDVIQVRDNGHGISQADRQLVAKRYCTSKIRNEDDLAHLGGRTLGFRGEALSNMAELCTKLSVTTRTDGEMVGSVLTFDKDGSLREASPISHAIGTTARLEGFLCSQPVRKQIVAKTRDRVITEISILCQAYALARGGMRLAFSVIKSTKPSERWVYASRISDTLKDIAMTVLGSKSVMQCELVEFSSGDADITALLPRAGGQDTPGAGSGDFVAIDGRPLASSRGLGKLLLKTIKKHLGLCKAVGSGKLGPICLNLAFHGPLYDVNIEPAKDDVHFEDIDIVLRLVNSLLEETYPGRGDGPCDQDRQCDQMTVEVAEEFDDFRESTEVADPSSGAEVNRDDAAARQSNDIDTMQSTSDKTALNPWTLAAINAKMSPQKFTPFSSPSKPAVHSLNLGTGLKFAPSSNPPKPPAPVHNVGIGLMTPGSSPVRQWTAINAHEVSRDRRFRSLSPPPVSERHVLGSVGETVLDSTFQNAPDDNISITTPSRISITPLPRQMQLRQPISKRNGGRKFNLNKPFKPPGAARKDPEKDAWFDIPQMHKDERARQREKQRREGSEVASPYRAIGGMNSRTEVEKSNKDIRAFMKPRDVALANVFQPTVETSVRDASPSFTDSSEVDNAMAFLVDETTKSPNYEKPTRSPLREIAPNVVLGREDTAPPTRRKSKSIQRSKSSMLPLERTPVNSYTQDLVTTAKSGSLLQEQYTKVSTHDICYPNSEEDPMLSMLGLKGSLTESEISMVVKELHRLIRALALGKVEFAEDFDHQVYDALADEEEEMLI